jgi:hypothetical protein
LKLVKENKTWGYRRIAGAIKNLGYKVSASIVANIMRRNGFNPSGDRAKGGMSWADFIKIHKDVILTTDFFTAEVWTPSGLATYYVLFFIQLKTRKVIIAGITTHLNDNWMAQISRNLTGWDGELENAKYLIHDCDTKYSVKFDTIIQISGIKPAYYHKERNHQGLDNAIPFPSDEVGNSDGNIKCNERLGGLLKYYYRDAA